jgi:PleD family two-component response regulator
MSRIVLIVDDSGGCSDTVALALHSIPDLEVRTVTTAQSALRVLAENGDVAALITDLHMPKIDGFELIKRVRSEPRHSKLPILVISGDSDTSTPDRLRGLGADAFFSKPFSPRAVRRSLERLIDAR